MAQFCTMVGALVLARATRGDPLSEELLQAARTALTESGTGQSEPPGRSRHVRPDRTEDPGGAGELER